LDAFIRLVYHLPVQTRLRPAVLYALPCGYKRVFCFGDVFVFSHYFRSGFQVT